MTHKVMLAILGWCYSIVHKDYVCALCDKEMYRDEETVEADDPNAPEPPEIVVCRDCGRMAS